MTQTVLLTGATGFLGSHLAKKLLEKGYRVAIFKRSFSDIKRIESIISDLIIYNLDECELDLPFKELNSIDFVIHTATCYGRGKEKPSEILDANICLPLKLLEILASMKQKAFLNTDSFFNTDTILYRYLNYYALSKKTLFGMGKTIIEFKKCSICKY